MAMSEVGYIPIYKLHQDYGFTEYEVRTAIEQFNQEHPEYQWVKDTLQFAGAKKPRVHLEAFARWYAEMEHARVEQRWRERVTKGWNKNAIEKKRIESNSNDNSDT
jgi:hypothetical protein